MKYKREEARILSLMSPGLVSILKHYNCYIGGGAITSVFTGSDINDLDIYFGSKYDMWEAYANIMGVMDGSEKSEAILDLDAFTCHITYVTNKAISMVDYGKGGVGTSIQFISLGDIESPEDIFDTFDFTCCMGAYQVLTGKFFLHKDFMQHNSQRKLVVNHNTAYPIISLFRLKKYEERGYSASRTQVMKLALAVAALDMNTWEYAIDQLGSMYGSNIGELLDTEKEFSVYELIAQIEDISDHDINNTGRLGINWDFYSSIQEALGREAAEVLCGLLYLPIEKLDRPSRPPLPWFPR